MTRLTKRLMAVTLALTATVAGLTSTGSPAAAASSSCDAGWFCVWTDSPYSGKFAEFQKGSNNLYDPFGGVLAGRITDVWNRTGKPWCMYSSVSYLGSGAWFRSGYNGYTGSFNDRALSLRPVPNPSSLSCW